MQIVIAGKDPTYLEEYLAELGHKVKGFYVNDLCLDIAQAYNPNVFIYMEDVLAKIPHEQALKQIQDYRVLIIATKENPIIPYAAALGIKDYVFQPCELSTILNRINQPATAADAAEMLRVIPKTIPSNQIDKDTKVNESILKNLLKSLLKLPTKRKTQKESLILLPNINFESINELGKAYLIDTESLTPELEINNPDIWKSDWRLGRLAIPFPIGKVLIFCQTTTLGEVDIRDQQLFVEFIEELVKKDRPVYVLCQNQFKEELLHLGAVQR